MGWQSKKKTKLEPREGVKTRARIGLCRVPVAKIEGALGAMCGELNAWKQT